VEKNTEEISLDEGEDDEEKEEEKVKINQKIVPDSVFGSLKNEDGETQKLGAAERLKRRKL
jgi:heterodisulfide reductase subunit C